jgi:hypothetical protein
MTVLRYAVFVALYVALGFTAERLKVSVNYYLEQADAIEGFFDLPPDRRDAALQNLPLIPYDYYHSHRRFQGYHHLTRPQLVRLKWAIAGGLIAIYLIIGTWALHYERIAWAKRYLYIGVGIAMFVALAFMAVSASFPHVHGAYAIARKVLGFIQSPLPVIFILVAARLKQAIG